MKILIVMLACGLAALTVWGFISPRGQWRVLAAWSRREPYAHEPGPAMVAVQRVVAGAGIVALAASGWGMYSTYRDSLPANALPPGPVEQMWGSPAPVVVNRVFTPVAAPPSDLVNQPILGYQVVNGAARDPQYLFSLDHLRVKGANESVGYIGRQPQPGLAALDTADLVIEVRGDAACIPQQVVVAEDDGTVRIAVYYGQPNPTDGSNVVNLSHCKAKPSAAKAKPVLVPIDLATFLGDRAVVTYDGGKKIPLVRVID